MSENNIDKTENTGNSGNGNQDKKGNTENQKMVNQEKKENQEKLDNKPPSPGRRDALKTLATVPVLGAMAYGVYKKKKSL